MRTLGTLAKWFGPILIFLGLALWSIPHLLPFRFAPAECAMTGSLLSVLGWYLRRSDMRRVSQAGLLLGAIIGLSFGVWQYHDESSAYTQSVVSFESQGTTLVGTLYLPNGAGPFPGIVIVHGSGRLPRQVYHYVADHLVRDGFAVLAYDKRGVGDSGGQYVGNANVAPGNIELLAQDASAALSTLAAHAGVRPDLVGYWGVSQAGWIVPRAAVINRHAAFMLLVSGPTTTTLEEMTYERLNAMDNPADAITPQYAEVRAVRHPMKFPFAAFDPVPDLSALNIPGLWLQGDRDWQVPVGRSTRILDDLIQREHKPYEYRIFHGAGHALFMHHGWLATGYWQTTDAWLAHVIASNTWSTQGAK